MFEDIRPYEDSEYKEAIEKLFETDALMNVINQYLPELSIQEIKSLLSSFNSIKEFQQGMVCRMIDALINKTIKEFTHNGLDAMDKDSAYLLISNHRDIVSDSALVSFSLNEKGFETTEIAIGSNLLRESWIKSLVRLNKSFIVKRDVPKQDVLNESKHLSAYIAHTIKEKVQTIWIAQREGRAKDGDDKTSPGLLKMFGLISDGNLLDHLISLNITPITLAYEYDPTDHLKLKELLCKAEGDTYVKEEGEDERSMMMGIQGPKGNVHLQYGEPINNKIAGFRDIKNRNELLKKIATLIDGEIYKNYKLWNSNYVAYDLLNASNKYESFYRTNGKEEFVNYMNSKLVGYENNKLAKEIFLKMYANPVINKLGE